MSIKDVRDLSEHLKLLGFPRVFPLQSLSKNLAAFHIVAEILQWLAGLLEPGTILSGSVQTEEERILFIRSATEFFVTKAAIKLNPRKLYAASLVTALELQKITRLLIAPTNNELDKDDDENYRSLMMSQVDIGDKMDDLRRARELSTDLTKRGTALYDLLAKELLNKEARIQQANRPMELASVERTMKNAISATQLKLQSSRAQLENGRAELNALKSKLQRKRGELERTKQRLDALRKIRPAHMQEFEECEKELEELFKQYFLRIHVRDSLKAQFERTKRITPASSPMPQKPNEASISFIPEGLIDEEEEDDDDDDVDNVDDNHNDGTGDGKNFVRKKYGLDADIPDIRDEDIILRESRGYAANRKALGTMSGKRAQNSRIRPTTGRNRSKLSNDGRSNVAQGENISRLTAKRSLHNVNVNDDDDDESTFGSSDSDLDMTGLIGVSGGIAGTGFNTDMSGIGDDDDDLGLNSIDDMTISKITGNLPVRPKTANKPDHHSDEDF